MDAAQRKALALVIKPMAEVYQVVPLRYADGVLTIAVAEEREVVKTDLKNFLGLERVEVVMWPVDRIRAGIAACYPGDEPTRRPGV